MLRDGAPVHQEAPAHTLLRPAKHCHIGARRVAAQHRHEGDDEPLTKVLRGAPGAGIGHLFEGGPAQMHGGDGL